MHEAVRQRLSIQFPPSMAITPASFLCINTLQTKTLSQFPFKESCLKA